MEAASGELKAPPDSYLEATEKYVVIRRKAVPGMSEGGVHIPETARAKMEPEYIGVITDIGPDVTEGRFTKGDRIVYSHNFPMMIPGEKDWVYAFVHQTNIMGKVHDESVTIAGKPKNSGLRSPDQPVER